MGSVKSWLVQPIKELSSAAGLCAGRSCALIRQLANIICVYIATWQKTTAVAVKTLKPGAMTAAAFLDEAKTMHKLRHRKLVQLLGVCTHDEPMYIITELMSHGALLDYLRNDEGRSISIAIVIDMAAQVTDSLRLSVCLSVCLSVSVSLSVCSYVSLCLSVRFSVCLFVCLSVCLSLCLCLSVCLSVCLFLCLSVSVCLFLCLSWQFCT